MAAIRWRVRDRRSSYIWEGPLVAVWEASGDPISDNYTPDEMSAQDLLHLWAAKADEQFPNGLVPIYWFVDSPGQGKFESMPFQYPHFEHQLDEHFLTFYHGPIHPETGERLNWLTIPVADKRWNKRRGDKGGFIQEATGWKPSILQPFVYLPSLLRSIG